MDDYNILLLDSKLSLFGPKQGRIHRHITVRCSCIHTHCCVMCIIYVVGWDLLDSQVSMHTKLLLYFVRKLASLTIIFTAFDKRIKL